MWIKLTDSYGSLEGKSVNIRSLLSFHVLKILESLNRHITSVLLYFITPLQCLL